MAKLYIVPTPIGNLEEMTYRSINILKQVKLIACEDTRNTRNLTNHYNISTPLISCHEHNEKIMCEKIISTLKNGEDVALVSDAGYPLISDPGSILVDAVLKNEFNVTTISGPCAYLNALVSSNMDLSTFTIKQLGKILRLAKSKHRVKIIYYTKPYQ